MTHKKLCTLTDKWCCLEHGNDIDKCTEFFYIVKSKGDHIPDPRKMVGGKLKPVDYNCLYKPITTKGKRVVYLGISRANNHTYWDEFRFKPFETSYLYIDRIPDYDYGDGGNYE